jgi:hypothetical protein
MDNRIANRARQRRVLSANAMVVSRPTRPIEVSLGRQDNWNVGYMK